MRRVLTAGCCVNAASSSRFGGCEETDGRGVPANVSGNCRIEQLIMYTYMREVEWS